MDAHVLKSEKSIASRNYLEKIRINSELVAAIFSGILILIAWILEGNMSVTPIILYVVAFIIGGFAKAKEGIEETIETKKLNVEMLMIFAAIGSASIGYWTEGAILIFIFSISGALETYTMNKSRAEISSLMELQPEKALRIMNDKEELVHVEELNIGDHILIKPGERVPSDGEIIKGASTLDESTITGESIPVTKSKLDQVFAGTVNLNGSITVKITKTSKDTLFQKIIELVQSAQSEKSPSQLFIERFESVYVKIVLVVVGVMMFLPHFVLGWSWTETLYRAMILLVVASPCALVASIMPATLSAISNGAKKGLLFKGGVHLEQLGNIQAIAFDKTGTLTRGMPEVTDMFVDDELNAQAILRIVASIENESNHPLANAIVRYGKEQGHDKLLHPDSLDDVPGWGIKAVVDSRTWKIGKAEFVGKEAANNFLDGYGKSLAKNGKTVIYVSLENKVIALFALKDKVRINAIKAIELLKAEGIHTIMLTGDSEETAKNIASESNIDEYIAECLPVHKVEHIKKLKEKYKHVAMVGDGINDAPALATADVGISMGEGTDVALETSDVVLMKNNLIRISEAIRLSKRMNKIIKQNIAFSIIVILLLIASNFFQVLDLPLGVIGHEGSTILVILNGLRLLK